ncbi:MAG: SDR family NAD-dependent epimerase/dehydratase, partial [Nitrospinota bacterium]|nr:SDR family NAD-dependent epimerase/dehydratase [Nitrospinota bacterium]
FHPLPVDDPKIRKPDIQRAKELLAWEPKTTLDEGIRNTISDFRRRLDQREGSAS